MRGLSITTAAILVILTVQYWYVAVSSQSVEFVAPIETECRGTIAECSVSAALGDEDGDLFYGGGEMGAEFEMDSEISRRMLAARRYISYGALRRNTVPCSRRGASYYNCRRGAQANPYSRGCSAITRCRR
ncbi:PREDICTED: rapid alkalinization factor 23-like [Camelina sativa]|uniref:Rapid alkalinization factor 23-like n=1 Tax=Camelina sativa TaxID=90675 RepID=A0ABM0YQJ8_CAMSA|nr:PREDICTED: rapid alkalinization factor 23-like [Camelina sativa]